MHPQEKLCALFPFLRPAHGRLGVYLGRGGHGLAFVSPQGSSKVYLLSAEDTQTVVQRCSPGDLLVLGEGHDPQFRFALRECVQG